MIVVADTSPVNYLILIGRVDVLPELFGQILIPENVQRELGNPLGPRLVVEWISSPPAWLETRTVQDPSRVPGTPLLQAGEREAIALALEVEARLLLMDDRRGRIQAEASGLAVVGTIGVLSRAATNGLLDLEGTLQDLQATNFRIEDETIRKVLEVQRDTESL